MNAKDIKFYLSNNTYKLIDLLEKLEFSNIKVKNTELRCAREEGHDANSIKIDLNNMRYYDYSKSRGGDIINLIEKERSLTFIQVRKQIVNILGLKGAVVDASELEYWQTIKNDDAKEVVAKAYTKDEFIQEFEFKNATTIKFYEDGISLRTQCEFELMYNQINHRIIIPWRNRDGGFVGYSGRFNGDTETEDEPKYLTMGGFVKGNLLYGMYENKKFLENKDKVVYVLEAEKSVMKAHQAGIYNCIAVGSHNISYKQIELLKELNSKAVIIAFDEGLEEFEILRQVSKLKQIGISVGYLFDAENRYLKKGSKDSPLDLGGEKFKAFVRDKNILKWM
ncbi:hypothetical protein KTC96_14275 [Clostridium estertheticum]|uniref:hypothetical protein n=1 Tax=Clostridium estertheticum TaxID=238834 RepID=UPI001C7E17A7|nr:hypothetical protein [Clostridium estertheticum]MBX4258838.1 hypothetical protein [Clostridium estertheticum]WLC69156.1 hypothetical protein KTC96_14275 [Clostridium estertheticum]